jgi:EAL domain-containing protein (putative c-di-GMP-specific phosphodiesterase class I)
LAAAERTGFPTSQLMFEITEGEEVVDHAHLLNIIAAYKAMGFRTAIDDFGAGYSTLELVHKLRPDVVKLDMDLIRGIDGDKLRRSIVRNVLAVCNGMGARVIAEGVETWAEYETLRELGIDLFQGYLFAKPGFQTLPEPIWPERERLAAVA